jgi:hypothetical protein
MHTGEENLSQVRLVSQSLAAKMLHFSEKHALRSCAHPACTLTSVSVL